MDGSIDALSVHMLINVVAPPNSEEPAAPFSLSFFFFFSLPPTLSRVTPPEFLQVHT